MTADKHQIKTSNRPLYLLAVKALQELIDSEYSPGDQLPSEEELKGMLGVSRSTLRVALGILEQKSIITRQQGVGTFVSAASPKIISGGLQFLQSIQSLAAEENLATELVDFETELISATEELAQILKVSPGAGLTSIKYRILIRELPVAFINPVIREDILPPEKLTASHYSFPEIYLENKDQPLAYTHSKIFAINANQEFAQLLNVEIGQALLHLSETFYSCHDEPIAISSNYFVTERFNFYIGRLLNK